MSSKPLVLRFENISGISFASQFLGSDDFDINCLRSICRDLGIPLFKKKSDLVRHIENSFTNTNQHEIAENIIIPRLIKRDRRWIAFKIGKIDINKLPQKKDAAQIVFEQGESNTWYGPILMQDENAYYYINFEFINHWEFDKKTNQPELRQIRWLRFARVTGNVVSLHWQGFYAADDEGNAENEKQFPYWKYIPNLFSELENLFGVRLIDPNLSEFVLDNLWSKYRSVNGSEWTDLRIRAESGGVSLNARSAGANNPQDLDIQGIKHLARTLSLSVSTGIKLGLSPDEIVNLQEIILRTLIREFGAKSYEFSLVKDGERLFKSHIYFGMRPNFPTADSFPHIRCYTGWKSDRDQFTFILDHLLLNNENKLIQTTLV
ncbi:MAG: hypothetical protein KG029_03405 [Bacteroidetes bacterium]|nr:hypothetical protein [Bacteroidota bacterium]